MNTDKIYAEQLANEYALKDNSKGVALRKLDTKAKLPATIFTYTFGIITAMVAGVGMCLSMKVIGNGSSAMFVLGVIVGIIGLLGMGVNYPIYKKLLAQHKRLFRTATENAAVLEMDKSYERMLRHVFTPILDRYGVPEWDRPYLMAFYIHGLMAIISEWLKNDCVDSIADIVNVIQRCVKRRKEEI